MLLTTEDMICIHIKKQFTQQTLTMTQIEIIMQSYLFLVYSGSVLRQCT